MAGCPPRMAPQPTPLVILDDPSAPIPPGWRVVDGFDLDGRSWDLTGQRVVCRGRVEDEATAAASVLALARGAGLHVEVALTGDARRRYLEDLHRIGAPAVGSTPPAAAQLPAEQQELLDLLASGATVTAAATAMHRSRRTVNRILADARERLGVATTAEAVARWAQLKR